MCGNFQSFAIKVTLVLTFDQFLVKIKSYLFNLIVLWPKLNRELANLSITGLMIKHFVEAVAHMSESSKFPKSLSLENQNSKLAVCLQMIKNSKFNGQIPLDKLKLNQKSYFYLQNSGF